MVLDLSEGSPEWRDALARVIALVHARAEDGDGYARLLRDEIERVGNADEPIKEGALGAGSAVTLAYQLALLLQLALRDYGGTEVTLDQILDSVQGKLEMHSGHAQAAEGDLDELLGREVDSPESDDSA